MKDGILILDKPQEWTSHDCVAVCRNASGVKKVGHGGTLDPMAEGLLPIFMGRATKIMEYLDLDTKTYVCTVRFGLTTDTLDIWGRVLEEKGHIGITEDMIREGLHGYVGDIYQTPPEYSAVKVNGKRLYEYARKGETVQAAPRKVHISRIDIKDIDVGGGRCTFEATCSKGTYIRRICSDLGDALGCGGVMESLYRTRVGEFSLENALNPEQIKKMRPNEIERHLLSPDFPLVHFGKAEMPADRGGYFCNGNGIRWDQIRVVSAPEEESADKEIRGRGHRDRYRVYQEENGKFLGIGYYDEKENVLNPDKIFADIDRG